MRPTLRLIYKTDSYPLDGVNLRQGMIEFISHLSCCGSLYISWVRQFSGWKKNIKKKPNQTKPKKILKQQNQVFIHIIMF